MSFCICEIESPNLEMLHAEKCRTRIARLDQHSRFDDRLSDYGNGKLIESSGCRVVFSNDGVNRNVRTSAILCVPSVNGKSGLQHLKKKAIERKRASSLENSPPRVRKTICLSVGIDVTEQKALNNFSSEL